MSCPVTEACYKVVNDHHMLGSRRFLVADIAEEWEELGQRIRANTPKVTTKRLRAFFCIETLCHVIVPGLDLPPGMVGLRERFVRTRFERSYGGLGEIIELCQESYRGLTIEQGEMQLSGQVNNAFLRVDKLMDGSRSTIALLERSARELRPMLRGTTNNIPRIGQYFGTVLVDTSVSIELCARYLRTLLSVSIHNPVSPWSMNLPG